MTELKDTVALMESDDFEIYPYWMIRLLFSWIEKLPSSDKSKLAGAVIVKLHEAKRNLLLKREKFLFWGKFEGYLMDISWTGSVIMELQG